MYQKTKRIIAIILGFILIVAALLYFVPWPTRVNLTLNATMLDSSGEKVRPATIVIKGWRLDYLFQEDQLNVKIQPFDKYNWIELTHNTNTNKTGIIFPHFKDCEKIFCYTASSHFCELLFADDFKYVAFVDEETYYVASANDQISYTELAEYFYSLSPFN